MRIQIYRERQEKNKGHYEMQISSEMKGSLTVCSLVKALLAY